MNIWLVWTESGEYEQYSRDLQGCFATEALANQFSEVIGGKVEAVEVLETAPVEVTLYTWADVVMPNGVTSPDYWFNKSPMKRLGRERSQYDIWKHLSAPLVEAETAPWGSEEEGGIYVQVSGYDKQAVKTEFRRRLKEAKLKMAAYRKAKEHPIKGS